MNSWKKAFRNLWKIIDVFLNASLKSRAYLALYRKFGNFCTLCYGKSDDDLNFKIL